MYKLIVVLGMHRSGTSVITRALKAMGVELGNNLLPAMSGVNEKGFWEDQDVLGINIDLLSLTGHDWYDNAPGTRLDGTNTDQEGLKQRAVKILRRRLNEHVIFAMKDPRTALLLPFWKGVFDVVGCNTHFLIATRNPKSIVDSLVRRDGFTPIKIQYLWLEYMLPSILETRGYPCVVVDYDHFMDDPESQMRRFASRLGLDVDFAHNPAIIEFLNGFLETGLRHSQYPADCLAMDVAVPSEVLDAFSRLSFMAQDRIAPDDQDTYALFRQIDEKMKGMLPLFSCINELERQIRSYRLAEKRSHSYENEKNLNMPGQQNTQFNASLSPDAVGIVQIENNDHDMTAHAVDVRLSVFGRLRRYFQAW